MPHPPPPRPAPAETATRSFLAGIVRPATVLAEAQSGDLQAARAAVGAAMVAFREQVENGTTPLAHWPRMFWAGLLAQPALRRDSVAGDSPLLGGLSSGPRAILLLRLVAGLDAARIGEALGLPEPAVRMSLARAVRALPPPPEDSLRELHARLRAQLRSADGSAAEAAPAAGWPLSSAAGSASLARVARAPRAAALSAVALVLVTAAFIATFLPHVGPEPLLPGEMRELPGAMPAVLAPEAAAIAHPDFEDALDPGRAALAEDLPFYAWLAGQAMEPGGGG